MERLQRIVIEHLDALSYEEWLIWIRYFGLQLARDDNAFLVTLVERRVSPTTARFSEILRDCGLAAHVGPTKDHPAMSSSTPA